MPNDSTYLSKNLTRLLKLRNLSAVSIAANLSLTSMTIRRILSGETSDPSIGSIKVIADFLDVSIDALLEEQKTEACLSKIKTGFIPRLDWETLKTIPLESIDLSSWQDWEPLIVDGRYDNTHAFVLQSLPSMQPRFPLGTLFVIHPNLVPQDGDMVLIKLLESGDHTLRELIIDPPHWRLKLLTTSTETIAFDAQTQSVVGTVGTTLHHRR
jgi:transcriptional regulator with XRE-family HTH domain